MSRKRNSNVIKLKIPGTREEWLKDRNKGIGGSDAGSVLGLNPWKSAYTLWCEKTGKITNNEDNEAMRQGRDLEEYVAYRFTEETGKKVRKSNFSYQRKDYPFMLANVDRIIVGENAILECKTASALTRVQYKKGEIPDNYYAQCVHYMATTGADRVYIAILVLGKGFYWYVVERDEEAINALISAEKMFWDYVVNDEEPPIDGSESTSNTLLQRYPEGYGAIDLFGREEIISSIRDLEKSKKSMEKQIDKLKNELKKDLGDHEYGQINNYKVCWKTAKQNRIDTETLRKKYPDIYSECQKEISFRKFEIKEEDYEQ
ncbi:YqaJ viral recombinase family protein [Holdemania sp. 1001302B_160321_E10]|uniref:YqaJ viral recombinase family nuclease n=1 Tax=Holdemania sp. 1001302B_160321_E10 TaxID=2787120 RepID=UPI00189858FB|nr:YqaJ viral recombinase family protein [Holdemania sp. 1001302B_160321_E10]